MDFLTKYKMKKFLKKLSEIDLETSEAPKRIVKLYDNYFIRNGEINIFRKKVTEYVKKSNEQTADFLIILSDIELYKNKNLSINLCENIKQIIENNGIEIIINNL